MNREKKKAGNRVAAPGKCTEDTVPGGAGAGLEVVLSGFLIGHAYDTHIRTMHCINNGA